ncbi:MAG: Phosphatidate cytidylyltransferase [Pedobacter sp.]|nr:Phosphatidate cytidylyltransferase [Pedobacter sp.]
MKTRAITALFFTLVMLGSFFLVADVFRVFYLLLSLAGLYEFYKLVNTAGIKPNKLLGLLTGFFAFGYMAAFSFFPFDTKYLLLAVPVAFLVFILELYRKEKNPFTNIGYTFLGLVFVVVPFAFFYRLGFLVNLDFNYHVPLSFMLMLWASDTGAYLFGRKLGKTKLFERHSPKKTWEGFGGGIFMSVLVAVIVSFLFKEIALPVWVGMAVIIVSLGTLGDLVESMLKRSLDVKDSGTLLPGHGGLLDRFDGLLIAAPMVYVYLYLLLK